MKKILLRIGAWCFIFRRRVFSGNPKHILVIKIGALGDVLMSTPLLRAIHDVYPNAKVTYAVGAWSAGVLEQNPFLDKRIVFNEAIVWKKQIGKLWSFIRELRRERSRMFLWPTLARRTESFYPAPERPKLPLGDESALPQAYGAGFRSAPKQKIPPTPVGGASRRPICQQRIANMKVLCCALEDVRTIRTARQWNSDEFHFDVSLQYKECCERI